VNNANQPIKSSDFHFSNTNYSQLFQVKNACGEQVLFVTFRKNHARQEIIPNAADKITVAGATTEISQLRSGW
jgi:hypothetical protein